MSINPDYLIERKRNKLQLAKWKILALILLLVIVYLAGKDIPEINKSPFKPEIKGDYIASVLIDEELYDDLPKAKKIVKFADDNNIKALIVHVNSPGGAYVGSEMLYDAFRKVAKVKPVVVVMDSVAASGGYMVSLAGDYIIAHNGTITGSIGVIMQGAEITELAEKLGIKFSNFKSGPLKANPNLTEKLTPEAQQALTDGIMDVYEHFIEVIAQRRNLDINFVRQIADGRIYSARLALKHKLIDEIGNEESAVKWLEEKKGITKNLKIVELKLNPKDKIIDKLFEDFENNFKGIFPSKFFGVKSKASI